MRKYQVSVNRNRYTGLIFASIVDCKDKNKALTMDEALVIVRIIGIIGKTKRANTPKLSERVH